MSLAHRCTIFLCIWDGKYSTGWWPPIGGGRSEMRLQRPKYTKLDLVFLQNVHVIVDSGKDFFGGPHFHFFGGSGRPFFRGVWRFSEIVGPFQKLWVLHLTICFTEATRLFIIISNAGATIFEMEPQFLKWSHNFWKTQITHLEMTICFNQATRLFIIISNAGPTIFEMDPQFLKNSSWTQGLRKKNGFWRGKTHRISP